MGTIELFSLILAWGVWDGGAGGGLSPSPLVSSAGCFSSSVYATQKQLVRKKKMFFWLGVNYFPLIISQKTNQNMQLQ